MSTIKKEWNLAICDMNGPWGNYAMWSKSGKTNKQTNKKQNTIWFHLYVESKKTNEQTKQNSYIQKTEVITRGEEGLGLGLTE